MRLQDKKILAVVDEEFEDLELWYPILRLQEEGATVDLVGDKANHTYVGKYGVPATSVYSYDDIESDQYDAVLVPGGWAPDKLRRYSKLLSIIKEMDRDQKPIGQICHAGWVLISAGILKGRTVTSTPGIRDDMENAGATWLDEAVIVDGHIVSSRRPPDLPPYAKQFADLLANEK
ncbi:type 1 glutamine amidotransferase domain-containing protein [Alkalicoccobacillus porphyridii]|uniref:Type 1 glutamine amidotransferase n=1 Tax=Alkalicoccobacillus porphyridii TaxID=2597270 RepID=A0A553ZZV9_9BACI|nr:type 1 glutamine amidotransferase domain-containing protein [Alkalicoccobacillus porphyridii]TSB46963.1 type 1 glutamine amidotransferase [Alkalicoccobacillus porphyridii]